MNCLLYLRVSTSDQSVEAQRMELQAYCQHKGWTITGEYSDTASGSRRDRPGLESLMAIVRGKGTDAVLCVKLDRMGRSLAHFATLVIEFEKAGVALICTSQGIDTSKSNACGRLQMSVLSAVAEFERELIRERTRAGLAVARAAGKVLGRPSKKMPAGADERRAIVEQWKADGRPGGYRNLGRRLGGVSGATAWRMCQAFGIVA